jgi:hypothetical protein
MKKQNNTLNALAVELGQTLTQDQKNQVKGGLIGITCEEKRNVFTGKTYMAMTGVVIVGIPIKWG